MRQLIGRILAPAVVGAAIAGCAQASPSPLPGDAPSHFALGVAESLAWFEERTLECLGPAAPAPDPREWLCRHEFADGRTLEVRITGDDRGVIQLVGVTTGLDAEDSAAFLVTSVAVLAAPTGATELNEWSVQRAAVGGVKLIGGALIELRPHSSSRAIIVAPQN